MEDDRCCGSATCIISAEGFCWCGQRWNGTSMCFPEVANAMAAGDKSVENSGARAVKSDPS